jgi:pimeloyl-ACP methyl ester carboxylesterase
MAHSAGAIYALATALRMPQHIRGRIHLLATWIPPSQLSALGTNPGGPPPSTSMPTTQKILRALPTPLYRAANTSFMSATSSSLTSSLPKSPRRKKTSNSKNDSSVSTGRDTPNVLELRRESLNVPTKSAEGQAKGTSTKIDDERPYDPTSSQAVLAAAATMMAEKERQTPYDARLTQAIWTLATRNANPAVDLVICLERRQPVGFRYVDINRSVVMHHGAKDTRVPVENVKWLGRAMRRCEVRVLPGEGHGLMASAVVMGGVLMEIAKEWDDWTRVVNGSGAGGASRRTAAAE